MATPTLKSVTPNLIVHDVNKTVDYYATHLGFTILATVPEEGTLNWAMIARDGVSLMFQSLESIHDDLPELGIKTVGASGTFYIAISGIDDLYQSLKDKVDIASDMRTTFYGKKEFTIKDINGYFIMFAEDAA